MLSAFVTREIGFGRQMSQDELQQSIWLANNSTRWWNLQRHDICHEIFWDDEIANKF